MYVARKESVDPMVYSYRPEQLFRKRVSRIVRKEWLQRDLRHYVHTRPSGFEQFRDDRTEFGREVLHQLPRADVINLHWIAGFLDYRSFFPRAPLFRPTVWTLHDMNPFTGGCHFDGSCGRFTQQCGCCPQLGSEGPDDLSRRIWKRKMHLFERTPPERLFLVTPSNWLASEARRSSMFRKFSVTAVPNGVDTSTFCPKSELEQIREGFGIPPGARVILFLAEELNNRRKQLALLNPALNELSCRDDLFLLSLGKGSAPTTSGIPHLHLGTLASDALLATIYSLADAFVVPSLQDNLPNTVLEAMSCGTPVIGFDTNGIREMIRNREAGFLVPVNDTRALADALGEALKDRANLERMGRACRQTVMSHFSLELQARRYARLYQALLDEPQTPPLHPLAEHP